MNKRIERKNFIRLIKNLAIGRITSGEFEDQFYGLFLDQDLDYIFEYGLYPLYDDDPDCKLQGKYKLSSEDKILVARIIIFLQSDFEYCWPEIKIWPSSSTTDFILYLAILFFSGLLIFNPLEGKSYNEIQVVCSFMDIGVVLLALYSHYQNRISKVNSSLQDMVFKMMGADTSVWPFFTREEYEYALDHPIYLAGDKIERNRYTNVFYDKQK